MTGCRLRVEPVWAETTNARVGFTAGGDREDPWNRTSPRKLINVLGTYGNTFPVWAGTIPIGGPVQGHCCPVSANTCTVSGSATQGFSVNVLDTYLYFSLVGRSNAHWWAGPWPLWPENAHARNVIGCLDALSVRDGHTPIVGQSRAMVAR